MKKIVFILFIIMSFFIDINVSAVHNGWNLITCPGSSQKCWSYYENNVEKKRLSKLVIIHSGWPGKPDNSLATLQGLKAGGYYALSADVHFTKDNIPVLSHDDTINRMAGTVSNPSADLNGSSPIYINSLTLSEINAKYVFPRDRNRGYLSAYSNNKITKFEDAVKYCHDNGLTMEVELKAGNGNQVKIALDIVKKYNMNGSVLWTSFHDYLFFAINDNTTGQLMQFFGPQMTDQQARDFYNNNKSRLANRNTYIVSSVDGAYVVPMEMGDISKTPQSKYVIDIKPVAPTTTEVTGISFEITSAKMNVGKKLNLQSRMTITPNNATNKEVTWSSSNSNVAEVNKDGVVTTKSVGTAIITAKSNNGKTATCTITVSNSNTGSDVAVTGISFEITTAKMNVGKKLNLKTRMTITPSNATNKEVTWSSSNPSVAEVNSDGVVTTKSVGTAIITAKTSNGKTATCTITVSNSNTGSDVAVTGISFEITNVTMNVGKSLNLKTRMTITPSNATNKEVTWSSSNSNVATVNSDGIVTTKSVGTAIITAKSNNGKTATCNITVTNNNSTNPVAVTGISFEITNVTMSIGKSINLKSKLKITPSNATNKELTWSSSNPSVAEVNSDGVVTTKSYGTAIITAKSNNGKTATCTITVSPQNKDVQFKISPKTIYLPIYDGTEYSRIKINAKLTNNGETVTANYNWNEIKDKYNVIGNVIHESDNSESIVISGIKGELNDKCEKSTYYIEAKYSSTIVGNDISICTYCSEWKKTIGNYQFDTPQKDRKEMLTNEGCYAYEDLDSKQSNINNNIYIYKTRYDRCCHDIKDVPESPLKLVLILVTVFIVGFGLPLIFKNNRKNVKEIK